MKITFDMNRRSEEKVWNINGEEVVGRMSNRAAGTIAGAEGELKDLTLQLVNVLRTLPQLLEVADGLNAAALLPAVLGQANLGYELTISLKEILPEVEDSSTFRASDMSAASSLLEEEEDVEDED